MTQLSHQTRPPGEEDPRAWGALLRRIVAAPVDEPPAPGAQLVRRAYRRSVDPAEGLTRLGLEMNTPSAPPNRRVRRRSATRAEE
jgi:hypothetical protein